MIVVACSLSLFIPCSQISEKPPQTIRERTDEFFDAGAFSGVKLFHSSFPTWFRYPQFRFSLNIDIHALSFSQDATI